VHDLGGPAGIAGSAQFPSRIRGIAAINALGWKPSGSALRAMLALVSSTPIRELNAYTGFLQRITATSFGVGRHLDGASRGAFRKGAGKNGRRSFHLYMRDARNADNLYRKVERALVGPFRGLPFLTIFGERNDPFGFQTRWKQLFPTARQFVIPNGNHFPMCDDPDFVAATIRAWHRDLIAPTLQSTHKFPEEN
jgi:haloalkane dehalogenase